MNTKLFHADDWMLVFSLAIKFIFNVSLGHKFLQGYHNVFITITTLPVYIDFGRFSFMQLLLSFPTLCSCISYT